MKMEEQPLPWAQSFVLSHFRSPGSGHRSLWRLALPPTSSSSRFTPTPPHLPGSGHAWVLEPSVIPLSLTAGILSFF